MNMMAASTPAGNPGTDQPRPADTWWQRVDAKLKSNEIPGLYGIRVVAVFLVIFFHFGFDSVNGALGVEMFFTLSGFLITWLLLKEFEQTGTISFRDFYIRRTRRIFPAMYVYLALGVAIYLVRRHEVPWSDVIASALYVQNYHDAIFHTPDSFAGHTWSLAIEEQFYLLWPLVLYRSRNNLARLTWILLFIIGFSWTLRLVLQYGFHVYQGYIYHAFETRMDQLAMGCLLAVVLKRKLLQSWWMFVTSRAWMPFVTIALLATSSLFHGVADYRYPLAYTIEPMLTAILLVQLIALSESNIWGLFNSRPMVYLGKISYSLYLYQQLTLFTARRLTERFPVGVQLAFAVLVTIVFAALSYHFIEQRFRVKAHGGPAIAQKV